MEKNTRITRFTLLGLFISLTGIFIVTTSYKLMNVQRTSLTILLREGLLFLLLFLLLWIIKNRECLNLTSVNLNGNKIGKSIVWGLAGALACAMGAVGTLLLLQGMGLEMKGEGNAPLPLWVTFFVILRAGIVEEVFFRGYAITRLEKITKNPTLAAMIPLMLFSLQHYGQGVAGIIVTFMMGTVLTILFLKRKDLLAAIIAHFVIDFIPNILIPLISGE